MLCEEKCIVPNKEKIQKQKDINKMYGNCIRIIIITIKTNIHLQKQKPMIVRSWQLFYFSNKIIDLKENPELLFPIQLTFLHCEVSLLLTVTTDTLVKIDI